MATSSRIETRFHHAYQQYHQTNWRDAQEGFLFCAEEGHALAAYYLGFMAYYGKGEARDLQRARHWFEQAAAGGSADARYALARMLRRGESGEQRPDLAFETLRVAAEQGHPLSMMDLALCYSTGIGTVRDEPAALSWFVRAGEAGITKAWREVARCFEEGRGTDIDLSRALQAYQLAAMADPDLEADLERVRLLVEEQHDAPPDEVESVAVAEEPKLLYSPILASEPPVVQEEVPLAESDASQTASENALWENSGQEMLSAWQEVLHDQERVLAQRTLELDIRERSLDQQREKADARLAELDARAATLDVREHALEELQKRLERQQADLRSEAAALEHAQEEVRREQTRLELKQQHVREQSASVEQQHHAMKLMEANLADRSRALDERKAEFASRQAVLEQRGAELHALETRLTALQTELEAREVELRQHVSRPQQQPLASEPEVNRAEGLSWEEVRHVWAQFRAELGGEPLPEQPAPAAPAKSRAPREAPDPERVAERKATAEDIRKRAAKVREEAEARRERTKQYRKRS